MAKAKTDGKTSGLLFFHAHQTDNNQFICVSGIAQGVRQLNGMKYCGGESKPKTIPPLRINEYAFGCLVLCFSPFPAHSIFTSSKKKGSRKKELIATPTNVNYVHA